MNKTVVILGSPRKNGNSETLAKKACEGTLAAGGRYDMFYLNGMSLRPCQGCGHCRRHPDSGCILKDDMHLIYNALKDAESLLIATPIYMFSVTAQLKLFIDRCYAVPGALKGKRVGILITYGDEDEFISGAVNAIASMRDEYRYKAAKVIGIVHGKANAKGEIAENAAVMEKAYQLGRRLAE